MKNTQQNRWLVDVVLLVGFLACFFLDLTGIALHQWLGIAAGVIASYHLISHHKWVSAITSRFFSDTSNQARLYYLIAALVMAGFVAMIGTGLVISTWFDLALTNYAAWRGLHILASISTLALIVGKIWLHRHAVQAALVRRVSAASGQTAKTDLAGRRAFLRTMGAVGVVSLFAFGKSFASLVSSSAATIDQSTTGTTSTENTASADAAVVDQSQAVPTSAVVTPEVTPADQATDTPDIIDAAADSTTADQGTTVSTGDTAAETLPSSTSESASNDTTGDSGTCQIRCGRQCSYPGHCRRYTDSNSNGRCDMGECVS